MHAFKNWPFYLAFMSYSSFCPIPYTFWYTNFSLSLPLSKQFNQFHADRQSEGSYNPLIPPFSLMNVSHLYIRIRGSIKSQNLFVCPITCVVNTELLPLSCAYHLKFWKKISTVWNITSSSSSSIRQPTPTSWRLTLRSDNTFRAGECSHMAQTILFCSLSDKG